MVAQLRQSRLLGFEDNSKRLALDRLEGARVFVEVESPRGRAQARAKRGRCENPPRCRDLHGGIEPCHNRYQLLELFICGYRTDLAENVDMGVPGEDVTPVFVL